MSSRSPLNRGELRSAIRGAAPTIGTFIGLGAQTAEIAGAAGADFIVVDTEHGAVGDDVVGPAVLAAGAYGVATIVRVESDERIRVGRALDAGAAGIMFPQVRDSQHAQQLLKFAHYPPRGNRGVATYNRAVGWSLEPENLATASDEVLAVVQIETASALEDVDAIAALPDVDVLFIGPLDLSYALGIPRDFSNPVFQDALRSVVAAAQKHGKAAGILAATPDLITDYVQAGFQFIAVGSDSTLFARALTAAISTFKTAQQ
ncbi:MAG TPA: aldolase/citrate lyase family protein [Actinomycetales bacterium]|nr:aldolase/citrate lyase family protein [Actinomycetales bacterium]